MANAWFESVAEAQRRAKKRLPSSVYSALLAGNEKGTSYADNTTSFSKIALAPHVAGLHAERDLATTFMGQPISFPVVTSPTGVQAVHPDGEVAIARATAARGTAIGLGSFGSKPLAEVVCSFSNPAGENTTEIVAEKGSVIQNYGDGVSCNVPRAGGPCGLKWFLRQKGEWVFSDIESPTDHGARIHGLARPLSEFLHGRRPPIATAEEGRTSLRMLLACYVSSREGRRVRFDDDAIARV